jgi:hypothetical protein
VGGGTSSTSLKPWLDPDGTGTLTVDTLSPAATTCTSDVECDDGLFCNGMEACVEGYCRSSDPCPGASCDEVNDECIAYKYNDICNSGGTCDTCSNCISGTVMSTPLCGIGICISCILLSFLVGLS